MPLLQSDPLSDPTVGLDPEVNPFVDRLKKTAATGELPVVYGPDLAKIKGQWLSTLTAPRTTPESRVVLEIGCHKGTVLVPLALDHPDWGVIGCDITFKRVILTAERLKSAAVPNARAMYANAKNLEKVFAPKELGGVIIFFPDPWSKKARQTHKRLIDISFVSRLIPLLAPGAFVWLKTDCAAYRTEASALFSQHLLPAAPLSELGLSDYPSSYERKFQGMAIPTYSDVWVKASE